MKTYFAKYLPVEGDIKIGDKFYEEGLGIGTRVGKKGIYDFQKVKLFLCSRDIQVGDEVMDSTGTLKAKLDIQPQPNEIASGKYIKVIGEISPEATWVKEGDEFDEDEVQFKLIYEQDYEDDSIEIVSEEEWLKAKLKDKLKMFNFITLYEKIIEIKGPCGHFH